MTERVRALAPGGVDLALDAAGSGVLPGGLGRAGRTGPGGPGPGPIGSTGTDVP